MMHFSKSQADSTHFPSGHQDKFAKLRAQFLSGLPHREAELEDLTATLLTRGDCPKTLDQLYTAIHKLAGICATYGLSAAGQQAMRAEELIDSLRGSRLCEKALYDILLATDLVTEELRRVVETD